MIRKSGWLVFIVFTAAVFLLVYFLAGPAIRLGMIFSLEKVVGAEVNIDKVAVRFMPLSLNIRDLQITDKNAPDTNLISFESANGALEVWPALLGYYVINDLSVTGLAHGSARKHTGKVFRGKNADPDEEVNLEEVLKLDLPDAEDLLSRADLQTKARGEALEDTAKAKKTQLDKLQSELPDENTLDDIEQQIKAITDSKIKDARDLASKTEQLKALKDKLRTEQAKLKNSKDALAQSRDELQAAIADLKDANAEDWAKLQKLANLSEGGLAPLSQILLGDYWGERIGQLESLYRLVKPYLPEGGAKGEGKADEPVLPNRILPLPRQPYPNFWVKNAHIDWLMGDGHALIEVQDITGQHTIINKPTRFQGSVKDLPKLAAFSVNGDFAVMQTLESNVKWDLAGYQLDAFNLGEGSTALSLQSGTLQSQGGFSLTGRELTQQARVVVDNPALSAGSNRYMQQLADILNKQDELPLNISASGDVGDPDVKIRSSLDKVLGDALLGEARVKVAALETRLRKELNETMQEALGNQQQWLSALDSREQQVDALEDRIEGMLKAELGSLKDSVGDKLKDSLLNR